MGRPVHGPAIRHLRPHLMILKRPVVQELRGDYVGMMFILVTSTTFGGKCP